MSLQEQLDETIAKIRTATAGVSATGGEFRLQAGLDRDIALRESFLNTINLETVKKLDLERQIQELLPTQTTGSKNIIIIGLIVVGAILVLR